MVEKGKCCIRSLLQFKIAVIAARELSSEWLTWDATPSVERPFLHAFHILIIPEYQVLSCQHSYPNLVPDFEFIPRASSCWYSCTWCLPIKNTVIGLDIGLTESKYITIFIFNQYHVILPEPTYTCRTQILIPSLDQQAGNKSCYKRSDSTEMAADIITSNTLWLGSRDDTHIGNGQRSTIKIT